MIIRWYWIVLGYSFLCFLYGSRLLAHDETNSWKELFNGRDLSGWDGDPRFWRAEKGTITGQTTEENPTEKNTFLIWNGGELSDFELQLEFRIVGGNSGIQFRSKASPSWVVAGYQADIDASHQWIGILFEERGRGILARRGKKTVVDEQGRSKQVGVTTDEAVILESIAKEAWNSYLILARGNHIVQKINGNITAELTDNEPGKCSLSGILALQLHTGPPMLVQFKNIRLKSLLPPATEEVSGSDRLQ